MAHNATLLSKYPSSQGHYVSCNVRLLVLLQDKQSKKVDPLQVMQLY